MADPASASGKLSVSRLLVRGVNWLGDAVMTTPALQRLRERFPEARITLLTREKLADLWQEQPFVDEVIRIGPGERPWSVGRRLRGQGFDLAVVFPNSVRSALETWWARIPVRVGFEGCCRRWLLTRVIPRPAGRVPMHKRTTAEVHRRIRTGQRRQTWPASAHQVHEHLLLIQALGASAQVSPPAIVISRQRLQLVVEKFGLTGPMPGPRPLFGLNPGAEYGPAKRWPADRYAAVAADVHRRTQCVWLITGGPADRNSSFTIERILRESGVPVINTAGRTSLGELCGLLKLCRVVLTNDTGPMHIAAAVGASVVVPFGSTSPELTGPGLPGGAEHRLLVAPAVGCAPCFRPTCPVDFECMRNIAVSEVAEAVIAASAARAVRPG